MDMELRDALARSMHRFKRLRAVTHRDDSLHASEWTVLHKLSIDGCEDINLKELHHGMFITKPAVSQILSGLERKGYIRRDIDFDDRRRIKIALTPDGQTAVEGMKQQADVFMDRVIERFGEEDMRQLVTLLNRLADTIEQAADEQEHPSI